jgi:hypothetical protein
MCRRFSALFEHSKSKTQQDCRMIREQGNRQLRSVRNYSVSELIGILLCNKPAIWPAAVERVGAYQPNADLDARPPASN